MKQNKLLYNNLVRYYNKCKRRLNNLIISGRNVRRQNVLQKHIERLFAKLTNLKASIQRSTVIGSVALAAMAFSNEAHGQITFSTAVTNPFGLTSATNYASPAFADLDNDGDMDMLTGISSGNFKYNVNSGTAAAPNYTTAATTNPFGLATVPGGFFNSPAFVDLDNDGDKDIVSGNYDGDFYYYRNTGTASAPSYTASTLNPFGLSDIGYNSAPAFADLDGDGDLDLLSGSASFWYFQNTGSASSPSFAAPIANPFGLVTLSRTAPTFFDLDGDGDLDLMTGSASGAFSYFQNIGSASSPSFAAPTTNPFSLATIPNAFTAARFVDLNGDGKVDLMTGNKNGVYYYNQNISSAAALNFDKTSPGDNVVLPSAISASLSTSNKLTVEAWVKPTNLSVLGCVIGNYNTAGNQMQFLIRASATNYQFWVGNSGTGVYTPLNSVATPTLNVWQHVAGVWNGSVTSIYVNGVLSATASVTYANLGTPSNSLIIGGNASNENFNGNIDEIRIWNRALCQGEIQNNMNSEIPTTGNGLLANYHFNQGIAAITNTAVTTLSDASGNAYTGTLTGVALTGTISNWVSPGGVVNGSTVTPFVSPTVSIAGTNSICSGSSTTLTASGNVSTYAWVSGPTTASNTISPTTTTSYSVVGTNSLGCQSNVVVKTITVNASPTITVNSGAVCSGDSFTITPSGANTYTIQGGSSVISPTATTNYTVVGTNTLGCNSNVATSNVTVNSLPVVTVNSGSICNGDPFIITPSGANTYTIQGGNAVVSPTATTSYTVNGTSAAGCVSANTATSNVTVNPLPTVLAVSSSSIICGPPFQGTANLTVSGANTYIWNTAATTSLIAVSPSVTTTYTVTGYDVNGCSNISIITQTVSACTGLGQLSVLSSEIAIFPNPSAGIFNLISAEEITIEVIDAFGRVIFKEKMASGQYELNLSEYSQGIYFVKARVSDQTKIFKLIKQ